MATISASRCSITPCATWAEFYAPRRLEPQTRWAVDRGFLEAQHVKAIDRLIARLPELAGPPVADGHRDRRSLWLNYMWLAYVNLLGREYLPRLMEPVGKYL